MIIALGGHQYAEVRIYIKVRIWVGKLTEAAMLHSSGRDLLVGWIRNGSSVENGTFNPCRKNNGSGV